MNLMSGLSTGGNFADITAGIGNLMNIATTYIRSPHQLTVDFTNGLNKFAKSDSAIDAITNGLQLFSDILRGPFNF